MAYATGGSQRSRMATLWLRDLRRDEPRRIAGPGRLRWVAWSPDSSQIAYCKDSSLLRMPAKGGDPIPVADLDIPTVEGGTWSPDGSRLLVAPPLGEARLIEIQVQGGAVRELFFADSDDFQGSFQQPQYLPDGGAEKIVYVESEGATRRVVAADLGTRERRVVARGRQVIYSPSGHLVYQIGGALWAMPFSVETLAATGPPVEFRSGGQYPSVSNDGTLAYVHTEGGRTQLVWKDRQGLETGIVGQEQDRLTYPVLSPDGKRVLVMASEEDAKSVWIHDVSRAAKTRVTFDSFADRAVWRPDGRAIAYAGRGPGFVDIFWTNADGTVEPKLLASAPYPEFPYSWSSDGRFVLFNRNETLGDLWYVEVSDDGEPIAEKQILATEFEEYSPVLSPDDRYVAYSGDKSGRHEVYVCTFPDCDREWVVSTDGGGQPRWRADGREMYYVDLEGTLFAVPIDYTPKFSPGQPGTPLQSRRDSTSAGASVRRHSGRPALRCGKGHRADETGHPGG